MFMYPGRVHGRVHGPSCTWQVGLPGHVHVPRQHATAECGPSRPCIRPAHSPFTAVYTAVYDGRYTAVRHVHTSTPQLKGHIRAMYTSVYTASTPSCTWQVGLHGRVHGPRRHVAAVGRVHGRNPPCTRSCARPIHSRVHVRLHGPCTRPRTRTVCRNGPHTAVACRLGTCTRPSRPTCRIHAQTTLVHGRLTAEYTGRYTAMYIYTRYVEGPKTAVYTAVYMTRYTAVYGRVDGRFRPCRWPIHGPCTHRHVDTCTRPYTCRVHRPYMAVYTSRVRGRVRPMYMAKDVRTDGCTQSCTR